MDDFEERVRKRAYRLWQDEGCPPGRAEAHWDQARELVAIEENQKLTLRPINNGLTGPSGEPVEPILAVENEGEFPTLTDQGEERSYPRRRDAPDADAAGDTGASTRADSTGAGTGADADSGKRGATKAKTPAKSPTAAKKASPDKQPGSAGPKTQAGSAAASKSSPRRGSKSPPH
jgi:hypothetical protein